MSNDMDDKLILKELRDITKDKGCWKANIGDVVEKLDIFYEMISDSGQKVRIEAPEMFRVIGKRKPEYVKPYLEKLEWIAENDENPIVRIHSAGAIRITKKALKES